MFTNPPYEVTIPENTPIGTSVLQLLYTDGDIFTAAFSTVRFIFDGGFGQQFGHFAISSTTVCISYHIVCEMPCKSFSFDLACK